MWRGTSPRSGLVVFVEDALFVGFVIPGETAALLGGVAAQMGHVPLVAVIVTVILAAEYRGPAPCGERQ